MVAQCEFKLINDFFNSLPSDFRMVRETRTKKLLPFIVCKDCLHSWFMYRINKAGMVRSNSKSNYVNHFCSKSTDHTLIDSMKAYNLDDNARNHFSDIFSTILSKFPTVSANAGVQIMNECATAVSEYSARTKKPYNFDISRQHVSKKLKSKAQSKAQDNRNFFLEHYESSSLIIDHWSNHGSNFLAIISRTWLNDEVCEKLLHFDIASNDKSSQGIVNDFNQYLAPSDTGLPIISDNCSVMVALDKYSNSQFFKIYCLEHKLSRIESKLHLNNFFAEIDSKLALINSYFNTRHSKFELPLKPPKRHSTTRPWRSYLVNYTVFCKNFDRYIEISKQDPAFPDVPEILQVLKLKEFEEKFCKNFNMLESKQSNLVTGNSYQNNFIKN